MWRTDGRLRRPATASSLPRFDQQAAPPDAPPEPFKGPFWCVPDSFDMTLAPGVWQIGVRRGVEHEAVFEDVMIHSGETMGKTLRPRRWVDMRRRGWWSGDDHVHCRILTSDDARNLMAWIQAEDVHLANVVQMGDIYRTYFQQRGFGPSHRVVDGEYVLAPGQECPRTNDLGHTLAENIADEIRDPERYFLYDTVFDSVHAQGGLAGYAHVNLGLFNIHRDMALNVPRQKVDFVEILQVANLGTDLYYDFLNLGCKLTASAGLTCLGAAPSARSGCPLREKAPADAWFDAFGRGQHCYGGPVNSAWTTPCRRRTVVKSERQLRVRARTWGNPKTRAPVNLEIVRHGDILGSVQSSTPERPAATLDFTVAPGHGFWIAARARSGYGTSAHTTPVYVIRERLRFWKFEGLEELIGDRLASLVQIEERVAEARRLDAESRLEADLYQKQLALQGPELLKRVELARKAYDGLKHTAEAERRRRGVLSQ